MKKEGDWFVDERGNEWSALLYSEEKAEKLSATLINCNDCSGCSYCSYCSGCSYCSYCSGCSYCSYCSGCSGCSYYKENPCRILSKRIGSRKDQTSIYWTTKEDVQVICGCFRGSLLEFKKAVKETHGENEFGKEYSHFIKLAEYVINQY